MLSSIELRAVREDDLLDFFSMQLDSVANHMAAFTALDPADWNAFKAHWEKLLADQAIIKRTILYERAVVGYIVCFEQIGKPSISYWIVRSQWGRGVATSALSAFLREITARPLYARAASDNVASIRVLKKCGFVAHDTERGYANAREQEIEETLLILE